MMRSVSRTLVRGVAAVLVAAAAGSSLAATSLKGWRDGPVSDLLTDDEYRRFGELRTDASRRTFIEEFWGEIDGGARAPSVSYRETFEQRCAAARARFEADGSDGWRTDRGRVFIALGEPSSIRHDAGGVNAIESEIWTYGSGEDAKPPLRMQFYRCVDGNYRLDPSCAIALDPTSVAYDGQREDYLRKVRDSNPAIVSGRLLPMIAGMLQPGPGGAPLPPPQFIRAGAARGATPLPTAIAAAPTGAHALENASYFFRARDGTVLTMLALELLEARGGGGTGPAVVGPAYRGAASIEETGRRGEALPDTSPKAFALESAPLLAEGRRAAFVGRVYLQPGKTYVVRYAVKDETRDEILVRNAVIGVPELTRGFSASSIVPAERFGPAGPEAADFQVGSEQVVPKAGGIFRRSELLRLYLQVYDAAIDARTSMPRVDVVFRFYRTVRGVSKRYGKPFSVRGAAGASMGLALPIGDWPDGPYRVEVELHDRVAEQRMTAEGRFSIAAD